MISLASALVLLEIDWYAVARNLGRGTAIGVALFLILYLCERRYANRDTRYLSRSFFHDLLYWLYARSDLHRLIFTVGLLSLFSVPLQALDLHLLDPWPLPLRWVAFFLVAEFLAYWIHRWQHRLRFLWAFHSVHHTAEQLTFATAARFHPLDTFVTSTLPMIPLLALGPAPGNWLPVVITIEVLIALQHTELPWSFGPLGKIVVSPKFHSFHHSTQPEFYNRNYARLLSIMDHIFGTAADAPERPKVYGVPGIKMPTLRAQLVGPFALLYTWYIKGERPAPAEAAPQPPEASISIPAAR